MEEKEIRSHYHMIYEKKIPRGVIKIDINALAPRSEIAKAFEDINEWFRNDCRTQDEETGSTGRQVSLEVKAADGNTDDLVSEECQNIILDEVRGTLERTHSYRFE